MTSGRRRGIVPGERRDTYCSGKQIAAKCPSGAGQHAALCGAARHGGPNGTSPSGAGESAGRSELGLLGALLQGPLRATRPSP